MYTRSKKVEFRARLLSTEDELRNKVFGVNTCQRLGLRSAGTPTCLHFGVQRKKKYPGCFFCSQCSWFEDEYRINNKVRLGSARFKCRAGHDNWVHPSCMLDDVDRVGTTSSVRNICKKNNGKTSDDTNIVRTRESASSDASKSSSSDNDSKDDTNDDSTASSIANKKSSTKYYKPGGDATTIIIPNRNITAAAAAAAFHKTTTTNTTTTTSSNSNSSTSSYHSEIDIESDDSSSDGTSIIGLMKQKQNNKKRKIDHVTSVYTNSVTGNSKNTIDSNTTYNIDTDINHNRTIDNLEVSMEDFEQLKQNLNNKFAAFKNEAQTAKDQSMVMKNKYDASKIKLSNQRSYYKQKASLYENKHVVVCNQLKVPTSLTNSPDYVNEFMSTIKQFSKTKNKNTEKLADNIVDIIWKHDFLDGCFVESLIRRSKMWFRENVFSPERILELMDTNGGHLSMTAVEILRTLETNGEKNCKDTILPSSAPIKSVCKQMDEYCKSKVPFEMGTMKEGGEFARFKAEHVIPLMYKAYGMEEESSKRPIKLNVALDSAKISSRIHHTTMGLKMADRMARDPKSGKCLVGMIDENSTLQSKHHCFPLKFGLQRENKSTIAQYSDILDEIKEMEQEGHVKLHGRKPPLISLNADMSATWKILKVGHAAKNCKHPCHLCAIHDDNLVIPNAIHCNRWCRQNHFGNDSIKCFHHNLLNEENVEKLKESLKVMGDGIEILMPQLNILKTSSNINVDEDPRGLIDDKSTCNPESIHFNTKNRNVTKEEVFQFSRNVTHDLEVRKLPYHGNLAERKERLRQQLIEEWILRKTHESLQHADKMDTTQFLLMQCVPCILHLENRVGIKILSMILMEGIKNAATFKLMSEDVDVESRGASNKCAQLYVDDMHKFMIQHVWGTPERPASWNIPYNAKLQCLEPLSICNQSTREVMANIDLIIDKSIVDEDRKAKYKSCIKNYANALKIMRSKNDLSNEEIFEFQDEIDQFANSWIELNQRAGMTNYIHLLASGHIGDFLIHYRNLYEHSQQGWEALNSMLKVFFFRRTTRGGGNGDGSKVREIARWLARRMVWLTKVNYKKIVKFNAKKKKEKIMEALLEENNDDFNETFFCHETNEEE